MSVLDTPVTGTELAVRRVAGHIGADVTEIDLARPLGEAAVQTLTDALHRHKVLFFRDQQLDHAAQVAFARQFGELTHAHPHEDQAPSEAPEILTIDPDRYAARYGEDFRAEQRRRYSYYAGWHTDVTATVNPPAASILRAETVPDFGGDTQWTNLVAAYEGLSEPLREFVSTLRAVHRFGGDDGLRNERYRQRVEQNLLVAEHPVVRVHPVTGERGLFVNPGFTSHVVGLSPRESRALLDLLYAELARPEYTVRFRWAPGSVAFWDNRATAHLAPSDLDHLDVRRTLHRVTLVGDVPVGPDGRESTLIEGRPFTAIPAVAAN
ncbi:TauD/TfdA dioxygenase family protein [Pseudonocardia sp. CA-107938]|uniref:TauD/TfdA dioxygenase family protein n=1 Tax=Pseudonocardia sp. CA-107938 TaxID=3240021 RepID=UPI003D8F3E12